MQPGGDERTTKVNVIQGVQVWNNKGQVRTRSEASSIPVVHTSTPKRSKPNNQQTTDNIDIQQILLQQRQQQPNQQYLQQLKAQGQPSQQQPRTTAIEPMPMDTNKTTTVKKVRKPRQPPRRLQVDVPKANIWDILKQVDSGISVAQFIATNKQAAKELTDGIRSLHGRKPKATNDIRQVNMAMPAGDVLTLDDLDYSDEEIDFEDESDGGYFDGEDLDDDNSSRVADTGSDFDNENDYDGDGSDTEYDYPYDYRVMSKSEPLVTDVSIHGKTIPAIIDTGASISVISEGLAQKLDLQYNDDTVSIQLLDGNNGKPGNIAPNVPVRIGGKLRREHFAVQRDRKDELLILGMTWLSKYGIRPDPESGTVTVPVGEKVDYKGAIVREAGQMVLPMQSVDREIGRSGKKWLSKPVHCLRLNTGEHSAPEPVVVSNVYDGESAVGDEDEQSTVWEICDMSNTPEEVKELVLRNKNCFVEVSGLGRVVGVEHSIRLNSDIPVRCKPYRLTWEEERILKGELDTLLEQDLIERSDGTYASPILFVQKKDGSKRLCIDYRKLNAITVKDAYPLPFIDELLDAVGGARIFSTLDAASGYWQVKLAEDAVDKTGFVTKFGTYKWKVLPFGLTTAPSTYQRMMENILGDLIGVCVYVFIDDIIIFSADVEQHLVDLQRVFDRCEASGLRLKGSKCKMGASSVEYLGHRITSEGLLPTETNVKKVMDMPVPRNRDEIRSFLGLVGYYRRFIPSFAEVAHPLTTLIKKEVEFVWCDEQQVAYEKLKKMLVSPPLLDYPDRSQVQILTTDASGRGLGAILSQSPDGTGEGERVIGYASRTVRGPEIRYPPTHLEALGVIWAVQHFRHYLAGRRFILYTDHSALRFIFNNPKPAPKLARWAAAMMEYEYETRYRRGEDNPADALSRLV